MRRMGASSALLPALLLSLTQLAGGLGVRSSPVDAIAGRWASQPLHVPTRRADQSDAVDGPLLGNGAVGAVLGGPASNLTWYLGANRFFGGPSGGASHCGYGQGGALQLGGVTVGIPRLANGSWHAAQNLSRSFVTSQHTAANATSGDITLSTRSFLAATDSILQIELTLSSTAGRIAVPVNLSLWTTSEFGWNPCSGNTVAFSGCAAANGSAAPCNATGGPSPTLFAARSNGVK